MKRHNPLMPRPASKWSLLWILAFLVLLMAGALTEAGEVRLQWQPSTGATGYKAYHGTASGAYGQPVDVPGTSCGGGACAFQLPSETLLNNCVLQFIAMTAYNAAGESSFSTEISGFPRPIVVDVAWFPEPQNPTHLHVVGDNFAPAVVVTVDGALVTSAVRQGCGLVAIPVSVLPPVQGPGSLVVGLCNGGVCMDHLVQSPAAPAELSMQ